MKMQSVFFHRSNLKDIRGTIFPLIITCLIIIFVLTVIKFGWFPLAVKSTGLKYDFLYLFIQK